jgi:hypothetical protein
MSTVMIVPVVVQEKQDYVALKLLAENQQKRLVLNNLSEVYTEFKKSYPGLKIWFSKSALVQL